MPNTTKKDNRQIANDPKLFIEELGYGIDTDDEQPGLWIWTAPADGCKRSFNSDVDALNDAWNDAVTQTLEISEMSRQIWDTLDFDRQRIEISVALTGEFPALADMSLPTQEKWIAEVRKSYPVLNAKDTYYLADKEFFEKGGMFPL